VGITSTTAIFSGDFFREGGREYWDRVAISDEQLRLTSHGNFYTIQIDLVGEEWSFYATLEAARRQALVDAVLNSNHQDVTEVGYEQAMKKQIENWNQANLVKQSSTRMVITIPKMPNYYLPPGLEEIITAGVIPGTLVKNGQPIENRYGNSATVVCPVGPHLTPPSSPPPSLSCCRYHHRHSRSPHRHLLRQLLHRLPQDRRSH